MVQRAAGGGRLTGLLGGKMLRGSSGGWRMKGWTKNFVRSADESNFHSLIKPPI